VVGSFKEGIEDGFLAHYKVVRVDLDLDLQGGRPTKEQLDKMVKKSLIVFTIRKILIAYWSLMKELISLQKSLAFIFRTVSKNYAL
jgi:hypothetical protein